jgi:hypothetical protein
MSIDLDELLIRYAAIVADRQNHFMQPFARAAWKYDPPTATLTLDDQPFRAGLLGTWSHEDASLLWAWANTSSKLPPIALAASEKLRAVGEAEDIEVLREPSLDVPAELLPSLAVGAIGVLGSAAFFFGAYPAGQLILAIDDPKIAPLPAPQPAHVIKTFTAVISQFSIHDHGRALHAYLTARGFTVQRDGNKLVAQHPGTDSIAAELDHGRMVRISTEKA